jgi:hypothetical protein
VYAPVHHASASAAEVKDDSVTPTLGRPKYANCSRMSAGAPRPISTTTSDSQRSAADFD